MSPPIRRLYISEGPVSVVAARIGPLHVKISGRGGVLFETIVTGAREVALTNSAQPVSSQVVELRDKGDKEKPAPASKPVAKPAAPTSAPTKSPYHRNVSVVGKEIHVRLASAGEPGHVSWKKHKALVVGNHNPFVKGKFVVRDESGNVYNEVGVPGSYLSGFNGFFENHPHLKGGETLVFTKVRNVSVEGHSRPCYEVKVVGAAKVPAATQNQVSIVLPPAKRAKTPSWGAKYGVLVVPAAVKPFFPKPKSDFVILDGSKRHVVRIPDGYISGLTAFFKDHKTLKVGDELVFRKESDVTVKGDTYPCVSVRIVKH